MNILQRIVSTSVYVNVNSSIPGIPLSFTASAVSSTEILLEWIDDAYNETGFEIEHSTTSPTTGFTLIETTLPNVQSYSHTGLTEGTTHYYKLRAVNSSGASEYVEASATTIVPAPSNLSATVFSDTRIDLAWDDNSTTETGFEIQRSLTTGSGFTTIHTTAANVESYSNTGLTANTTYYYRVRAVGSIVNSEYSAEDSDLTLPAMVPPSDLIATAVSASQIDLEWADNSTTELGFEIHRSTTSGSGFSLIHTTAADVTTYSNTGLSTATTYYYKVRATNASGETVFTSEASATTQSGTVPIAPTLLVTTAVGNTNISLSWTDNSSDETGFQIERSPDNTSAFALIHTTAAGVNTYADTGLDEGRRYHYRVRAVNGAGNSGYTNTVQELTTWTTDVAWVNKGSAASSATSTLSLALPVAVTAGRILIAIIGTKTNKTLVETPANWNTGSADGFIDYTAGQGGGQGSVTGHVFWKIAGASETGPVNFTILNTPNSAFGMIYQFEGDANAFWSIYVTAGSHRIPNTSSYSVTSWDRINLIKGDILFAVSLVNYVSVWSAQALTHTGSTISEVMEEVNDSSTTTGNDQSHISSLYRCTSNTSVTSKAVFTMTNGTAATVNAPIGITMFIRLRNARIQPTYTHNVRTWRGADIVHLTPPTSPSQDTLSLFDGLRISQEGPDTVATKYSIASFNGRNCMKFKADLTTGINRRVELSGNWQPTLPLGTQIIDEILYETDANATQPLGEFIILQHHTGTAPGGPWPTNSPLFYFAWTYNGQSGFDNVPGTSTGGEFQFVNNCKVSGGYIRNRYSSIMWGPNKKYRIRYHWIFDIVTGNPMSKVWVAVDGGAMNLIYEDYSYPTAAATDAEMGSLSLCAGTTKLGIYHHMVNTEANRTANIAAGHTGVTLFIPCRKQIIMLPNDSFYFTDYTNNSAPIYDLVSTATE